MGKILENGFEATLWWKTNIPRIQLWLSFAFFQIFEWRGWNHFLGKQGNVFVLKLPWGQNECSVCFKMTFFTILQISDGGIQLLRLYLGGRRVHQNANIWNREEGDFTSMWKFTYNFSTEHLVHELPTIITRLYARKWKQAAQISRKILIVNTICIYENIENIQIERTFFCGI